MTFEVSLLGLDPVLKAARYFQDFLRYGLNCASRFSELSVFEIYVTTDFCWVHLNPNCHRWIQMPLPPNLPEIAKAATQLVVFGRTTSAWPHSLIIRLEFLPPNIFHIRFFLQKRGAGQISSFQPSFLFFSNFKCRCHCFPKRLASLCGSQLFSIFLTIFIEASYFIQKLVRSSHLSYPAWRVWFVLMKKEVNR